MNRFYKARDPKDAGEYDTLLVRTQEDVTAAFMFYPHNPADTLCKMAQYRDSGMGRYATSTGWPHRVWSDAIEIAAAVVEVPQ